MNSEYSTLYKMTTETLGSVDMQLDTLSYLDKVGIRHANAGYRYLDAAILLLIEDPSRLIKVNNIYKEVGEQYKVRADCVERSIRYVLEQSGETVSNKEFIARAVDHIRKSALINNNRAITQNEAEEHPA